MLVAFCQELASRFQAYRLQQIELLIEPFRANPHSWLSDLSQPLGAMTGRVDGCTRAGNRPTAVQSFDAIHDASDILGDGQITAPQFFQGANAMLSVIHRMELVTAQQLRQLARIDSVVLIAIFQKSVLSRIAD